MKKTICCVLLISPLLFVNDSSASLVVSNIERVVSAEINYSYYTTMSNTIGIFNEFKSMNYPGSEWDEPYNINAYQNSNISATTDALSLSAYGYISADGDHYGGWTPSSTVYLFFSTDNSYSYSYSFESNSSEGSKTSFLLQNMDNGIYLINNPSSISVENIIGTLDPGNYLLEINDTFTLVNNGYYFNDFNVSFSAEPLPAPIPGAVWLLGSGFTGLIAMRRRKK